MIHFPNQHSLNQQTLDIIQTTVFSTCILHFQNLNPGIKSNEEFLFSTATERCNKQNITVNGQQILPSSTR